MLGPFTFQAVLVVMRQTSESPPPELFRSSIHAALSLALRL
jgi:hypothetical protein